MASGKGKNNRAKKLRKNAPSYSSATRKKAVAAVTARLDASAAAFARLLMDPCQAPLVHPVYAGSDAGYLGRFETDFLCSSAINQAAGCTAGAILFSPGCIGVSATDTTSINGITSVMGLGSLAAQVVNDSGTYNWQCRNLTAAGGTQIQPGAAFFAFASESVRCVAACVQLHYIGTELDRAGTISMARVNAGSVLNSDTASVSGLRQLSNYVDRTPESHVELKWCPADGDQLFTDPSLVTGQRQAERKNGLLVTYSGIDPSKLRVRFVAVYEWLPETAQGLVTTMESRNRSSNSLDHVLNALDRTGRWWQRNGHYVSGAAGMLYKGAATLLGGM